MNWEVERVFKTKSEKNHTPKTQEIVIVKPIACSNRWKQNYARFNNSLR
jgi:hypothetical protein